MKRKILLYTIPTLFLLVAVGIMISGSILKEPLGEDDHVIDALQELETDVKAANWVQAKDQVDEVSQAWSKVVNRIQFSIERQKMREIDNSIFRLKGSIEAEDEQSALIEIYFVYEMWDELGS